MVDYVQPNGVIMAGAKTKSSLIRMDLVQLIRLPTQCRQQSSCAFLLWAQIYVVVKDFTMVKNYLPT